MPATSTRHNKVGAFFWGAPEPTKEDRKHLELIRQSAREAGAQVETLALDHLEAKGLGPGTMATASRRQA